MLSGEKGKRTNQGREFFLKALYSSVAGLRGRKDKGRGEERNLGVAEHDIADACLIEAKKEKGPTLQGVVGTKSGLSAILIRTRKRQRSGLRLRERETEKKKEEKREISLIRRKA